MFVGVAAVALLPALGTAATFTGSAACKSCHEKETAAWADSQHALAMRASADPSVLAPFAGETTSWHGASATLLRQGEGRAATAEVSEGGKPAQSYTTTFLLGRRPMEQYLADAGKGRFQALPFAYDTGARQWFDVFSGEERLPGDFGHWLGRGMNANGRCLYCHTTDYRSAYDEKEDAYASTWKEIGVGCESCHGPGSAHVADPKPPYGPFRAGGPLAALRPSAKSGAAPAAGQSPPAEVLLDTCASCHSLRRPLAPGFDAGGVFLDSFEPVVMDEDDYRADGSIAGESYEWGSFLQSKMYRSGVNCLACHDAHSGGLKAEGNALCLSCHDDKLASGDHTHHRDGSTGSACVACHMPEHVFMARDHRRDHALSIPDPIGAAQLGLASPCESCHSDQTRQALADKAGTLWPALGKGRFMAARALAGAFRDARQGRGSGAPAMRDCASGKTCDDRIRRAGATRLLAASASDKAGVESLLALLGASDPLLRGSAAFALADVADPAVGARLVAATRDASRLVRVNAAWALRGVELSSLAEADRSAVEAAFTEWMVAENEVADQAETQHTIGVFLSARGDLPGAERAYRRAIAMEPGVVPPRHNLAMLLVGVGRIDEARTLFQEEVGIDPQLAAGWYALGVIDAEQGRPKEAADAFTNCLKANAAYPDALIQLTRAYLKAGVPNVARVVLGGALEHPASKRDALVGLILVALDGGNREEASRAARALIAEDPSAAGDPQVAELAGP